MDIKVNGRHVEVTEPLRLYAEEKIGRFDKYLTNISEAIVTLSVQKHLHKVEVLIKANGTHIQAESVTEELYSAIDEVVEKIDRQIKKLKGKIESKRKGSSKPSMDELQPAEPDTASSDEKMIIERQAQYVKPMPAEEAAMRLEADGLEFFAFTNAETGLFSVIYKRKDGNFVMIEPASK